MISTNVRCYTYYRFSTPKQIKGDSLQRQLKLSEHYANEKGWVLDDSLKMDDLGLSAYKGDNIKKGQLGAFLIAIEKGKIPKGSVLIVESLDRITRTKLFDALTIFIDIIKHDITIVTLADRMEYSKDIINNNSGMGQLMISLGIMSRAYEESAIKSLRLKSAWKSKRKNIENKKMTGRCPAWLYLDKKQNKFLEIPERCELVKRIYRLSLDGMGVGKIAKTLNFEGIPSFGGKKGWQHSYILKILHNRSVLGEFQPRSIENEKYVNVGEPIKDYFPQIIFEETFYRVQHQLRENIFVGKHGEKYSNLLGGIVRCGYCNQKMQFINKGNPPKSAKYLACDNARRGVGCKYHSYRYDKFENALLLYCRGLDVEILFDNDNSNKTQSILEINSKISALKEEISSFDKRNANLLKSLADEDDVRLQAIIKNSMKSLMEERELKTKIINEYEGELNNLVHSVENTRENLVKAKDLIEYLASANGSELIDVRRKLRIQLRSLIEQVDVFPAGSIIEGEWDENGEPLKRGEILSPKERDSAKYFIIYFKSGATRVIFPADNDLDDQVVMLEIDNGNYRTMLGNDNRQLVDIACDEDVSK